MAPPHVRASAKKSRTTKSQSKGKAKSKAGTSSIRDSKGHKGVAADPIVIDDSENETAQKSDDDEEDPGASFPIVLTTYEMIIKDRVHLAKYNWGYIVVDEGHRLKNLDCALMREIKKYPSAGRMILTGTPLHVSAPLKQLRSN